MARPLAFSIFATGVATGALIAAAAFAAIVPQCSGRAALLGQALALWRERPVAGGQLTGGAFLEVLASQGGATFTLIVTGSAASCIVETGEHWRQRPPGRPT